MIIDCRIHMFQQKMIYHILIMASLMIWIPWSMIIVKGYPNLVNMHSYKKIVMAVIILVLNVLASTHLVA
jgi:hypothetical protein